MLGKTDITIKELAQYLIQKGLKVGDSFNCNWSNFENFNITCNGGIYSSVDTLWTIVCIGNLVYPWQRFSIKGTALALSGGNNVTLIAETYDDPLTQYYEYVRSN